MEAGIVVGERAAADVALPSQNQLYALYRHVCGVHRLRKPTKAVLALLREDAPSFAVRREKEAASLLLRVDELPDDGDDNDDLPGNVDGSGDGGRLVSGVSGAVSVSAAEAAAARAAARAAVVPLARREEVSFAGLPPQHFGGAGVCALLQLLAHCPLLQRLDLRNTGSFFSADAFKLGPTGNDVIAALAQWAILHPTIRAIDLRGQPLGTAAAAMLLLMLQRNGQICELQFDADGVDWRVVQEIEAAQVRNRTGANAARPPAPPTRPAELLLRLRDVDRKTSRQLQALQMLLWDRRAAFMAGEALTPAALEELVLQAQPISLAEVVQVCRGLRGDDAFLYVIESGQLQVTIGTQAATLGSGDYFGEPLESVMFSGGTLSVVARGGAFRIPFGPCTALFSAWEGAVARFLPLLRRVPCLQALSLWPLIHACHDAELVTLRLGDPIVARGAPFSGLFVVASGEFCCPPSPRHQQHQPDAEEAAAAAAAAVVFSCGDLVGYEAAIARHGSSSVDIVVGSAGGASAIRIGADFARRHLIQPLRAFLRTEARLFSLHDDI